MLFKLTYFFYLSLAVPRGVTSGICSLYVKPGCQLPVYQISSKLVQAFEHEKVTNIHTLTTFRIYSISVIATIRGTQV